MSFLLSNIPLRVLCSATGKKIREKRKIVHVDWKGRSKVLFIDNMIFYVKNMMQSIKKVLELKNDFRKITG